MPTIAPGTAPQALSQTLTTPTATAAASSETETDQAALLAQIQQAVAESAQQTDSVDLGATEPTQASETVKPDGADSLSLSSPSLEPASEAAVPSAVSPTAAPASAPTPTTSLAYAGLTGYTGKDNDQVEGFPQGFTGKHLKNLATWHTRKEQVKAGLKTARLLPLFTATKIQLLSTFGMGTPFLIPAILTEVGDAANAVSHVKNGVTGGKNYTPEALREAYVKDLPYENGILNFLKAVPFVGKPVTNLVFKNAPRVAEGIPKFNNESDIPNQAQLLASTALRPGTLVTGVSGFLAQIPIIGIPFTYLMIGSLDKQMENAEKSLLSNHVQKAQQTISV